MRKRVKKVMLVTPPYHSGVVESAGVWLPLGLVYIAGSLRQAGYDVEIYDAMSLFHTHEDIIRKIITDRPDVVATTAITASLPDAVEVLSHAKMIDEHIITVIGNVHPTFMFNELLNDHSSIDYVVRGEGEVTFVELLDAINACGNMGHVKGIAFKENNVIRVTPNRELSMSLDALTPAWDLVNWEDYRYFPDDNATLGIVSSSRGCIHQCSFCSQQLFWEKRWRQRSALSFVNELEMLSERYGVKVVMLADEYPTANRQRWVDILNLIIQKGLKIKLLLETRVDDIVRDEDIMDLYVKAGVSHIYVGVESGSNTSLELFKKDIKAEQSKRAIDIINKAGIISETSFVLGMPYETHDTISHALDTAVYYNPDMAFFLAIAPWPYSDIYPQLKEHITVKDYRRYNLVEPVVKPDAMELSELEDALVQTTKEFYMHKMRQLKSLSMDKRRFMVRLMTILMKNSYIGAKLRGMMKDDEQIRYMMQKEALNP
ncbi:MAG: B12-binding domain-containing radical SAM protein [Deltaproteobacteria bacterium]|nr:B12-binding domain-containing radical SAM protein [Deltaproteobacteria bacterium]MCL5276277.1 B12-binding domain-containing radical SAM protein [Deltaproteobacteria bacterium]